ncbi:hypothetical protein PRZ61_09370 [Halomonas pacifica]|uniref:hypothetical protein n=1 Tax=Bisbaumannia pacifica TaxID=77098 RepID=UPI0023596704|nr:hypothetical protein [Halomonas pacifica]MDC8803649.1 hypothetical protein [Halomonas pacifica]
MRLPRLQRLRYALPLLLALALSGCFYRYQAQAPVASSYPYSEQQRMQAAHHWEILAEHQAEQILDNERLRGQPLHLVADEHDGEFSRGFHALLTSALVRRGAWVTTRPEAAIRVDFDVEAVTHNDRGYLRPPHGALTAVAAGIAVAALPINQWREPALALIPAAAGADVISGSWVARSDQEVIITTRAIDRDRILYSSSQLYYINEGDSRHYAAPDHRDEPVLPSVSISNEW